VTPAAVVVGAGWAGLAAAVGLSERGWPVTLLDAAPQPGGRARSLALRLDAHTTIDVDNGQHLLIGAYRATLGLLHRIGVAPGSVLDAAPLALLGPDGFELRAARLPAPLNLIVGLLRARGLSWPERLALTRALAPLALGADRRIRPGTLVADWLAANRQPERLVERLWTPLCVGALNTPLEAACARAFARVLRDALLAGTRDSDFLLPRSTLGDVLPEPACAWLRARGAQVRLRTAARRLARDPDGRWRVVLDDAELQADRVVLAVPPPRIAALLSGEVPAARLAPFEAFEHEPIATVWLAWRESLDLPATVMLRERPDALEHGQWLFGRTAPDTGQVGAVAGVVVSTAGRHAGDAQALADGVARQVSVQLGLPPPAHARAIVERRATIRCTPGRPRIEVDGLADVAPGLALAGDWTWHAYPATIESAVRSGDAAATWLATGTAIRP
jgi:squalene-associated FAD-dependent desaturase